MGIFEKLGLRTSWSEKEAKIAKEEEQQKKAPAEFKAESLSEDEERFNYLIEGITGKREEREELGKKEAEEREQKMLEEFISGIGGYTAKAEGRHQGFLEKLAKAAKDAYIVPKFAVSQVADVAKGLGEGIKEFPAAALNEMQGAGYSIGEFVNKYSGVAATKYEAANEWVRIKSVQARTKGTEAYGNLKAEAGAVKDGALKKWNEWQRARDEGRLAKLTEKKFKKLSEYAQADAKLRYFKMKLEEKAA